MRPRQSILWSIPKEQLVEITQKANSFSEILRAIGLTTKGTSNFHRLRQRLTEEGIDYSHIKRGRDSNKGRKFGNVPKIPLKDILVEGSSYNRNLLKRRLIKEGILEEKCSKCGLQPEWEGERLVMVLDHINGVHNDNRIGNLRLLCPNCNSQTSTFAGKSHKNTYFCACGQERHKDSEQCLSCYNRSLRKVERPSKEELKQLVWSKPTCKVAKDFGVSDKAIEKWCKHYCIDKPPRGYWSKHNAR